MMSMSKDFQILKEVDDIMEEFWQTIELIIIAIAYIIVWHLSGTGRQELARRKKEKAKDTIKVVNYTAEEVPQITDGKPSAFTYVEPEVQVPEVKKKKGGFVSKEFLRAHLAKQVVKD